MVYTLPTDEVWVPTYVDSCCWNGSFVTTSVEVRSFYRYFWWSRVPSNSHEFVRIHTVPVPFVRTSLFYREYWKRKKSILMLQMLFKDAYFSIVLTYFPIRLVQYKSISFLRHPAKWLICHWRIHELCSKRVKLHHSQSIELDNLTWSKFLGWRMSSIFYFFNIASEFEGSNGFHGENTFQVWVTRTRTPRKMMRLKLSLLERFKKTWRNSTHVTLFCFDIWFATPPNLWLFVPLLFVS